ncbi:hypothetical protein [Burkholderia cepacia]|uniref:hypothetical protein n=1 Tax=Burkholderia cepacia TaxID=292 RepID=UPI0010FD137C|nr:hypothetical protein [Burkholderia cepacia]MCA8470395.1 hypothetical protein [Burkholderia cepacia]QCY04926.1 hypothetical protein EJ998_18240 [Burkholderia cepacia ATCC 25416]
MSVGDELPDEHHIARLCKGSSLDEEGNPTGASFMLRDGESYLSVNWLELVDPDNRENALALLKPVLAKKMTITGSWRLATLNVGQCKATVADATGDEIIIRVAHEPIETETISDPSHSGIHGYSNEETVVEKLAAAVTSTCPAK